MALSGSFERIYNSHWKIRLDWWASQNIANNTSTIYTDLFLVGIDGHSRISAQQSKSGYISIHNTSSNFSAVPSLNPYQEKHLHSHQATFSHDANGDFECDIWGNFALQISGVGTVFETGGHIVLDRIPRASTISNTPSYTMFNKMPLNINRASTNFTHTAKIYVGGTLIKTVTGIGGSTEIGMTVEENTIILEKMNGASSIAVTVELLTYNGGTHIGTTSKSGWITAPSMNSAEFGGNFTVGATIGGNIVKGWDTSNITTTIQLRFNNGANVFTVLSNSPSTTWSYDTNNIRTSLNNLMSSNSYIDGYVRVYSYYNGKQIRTYREYSVRVYSNAGNPNFGSNGVTYKDSNPTTVAVTGNNQYLIQGRSTLEVSIPSAYRATAVEGATMSKYKITVNGVTETVNYSTNTIVVNFGVINSTSDISIIVDAIDSRGNSTRVVKWVNIVPYSPPTMTVSGHRSDDFSSNTVYLSAYGSVSPINVNGVNKNSILSITYRYRQRGTTTYNSPSSFNVYGFPYYSTDTVSVSMNNAYEWDVLITITDKIGSWIAFRIVPSARPIFYIDSEKRAISVNKVPEYDETFEISGNVVVGEDILVRGGVAANFFVVEPESSFPFVFGRDISRNTMLKLNTTNGHMGFDIESTYAYIRTGKSGLRFTTNDNNYYLNVSSYSSYTSISTNSNRIDFDSPVSFYSKTNFNSDMTFSESINAEVSGIGNIMAWYGLDNDWNGGTGGSKKWVIAQIYNYYPDMRGYVRRSSTIDWHKPLSRAMFAIGQAWDTDSTAMVVRVFNRSATNATVYMSTINGQPYTGSRSYIESHVLVIGC